MVFWFLVCYFVGCCGLGFAFAVVLFWVVDSVGLCIVGV